VSALNLSLSGWPNLAGAMVRDLVGAQDYTAPGVDVDLITAKARLPA
jgi:hypothetical protein